MSQETKIKIGKVANIIATIIFVVFIVVVFAGIPMTTTQFIVLMAVLFILFYYMHNCCSYNAEGL